MGNALGPYSRVTNIGEQHVHLPPDRGLEVTWPLEIGAVPALATAFQSRSDLRKKVEAARSGGESVVLTQVLSGGGGVGKSQLAAAYATEAVADGTELVVWASAAHTHQVVTQYAQAAVRIGVPGADEGDPEGVARAFLSWLATTQRRWLVVLDDITDPTGLAPWWPASRTGTGWVLATSRLHDARLSGGGRTRIAIDVYTPEEAHAYLRARLDGDGMGHLLDDHGGALAEALGYLPLALGHAAAYMINEDLSSAEYLDRFHRTRLEQALPESADADGYGRQISATLLLSLEAAERADPTGLATPALILAALLDPAGHPRGVWGTPAALRYLTICRMLPHAPKYEKEPAATAEQAHAALRILHRYALLTCDTRAEPRAVRIHALTARAVRESTPAEVLPGLAAAAAYSLLQAWPDPDQPHPDLAAAMRANTDALARHSGDHLWYPEGHPVLYTAGNSLANAGLAASATAYWQQLATDSDRIHGPHDRGTLVARIQLGASHRQAGRTDIAVPLLERVLADCEGTLGPDNQDTLVARGTLANVYQQSGRADDAITLMEQVVADCKRRLEPDHPNSLAARHNLAAAYGYVGRTDEALSIAEQLLDDCERTMGSDHPNTLAARGNLAGFLRQAGRNDQAMSIEVEVLATRVQTAGPDHPDTIVARSSLAASYLKVGRIPDAVDCLEQALRDSERILSTDHPTTLNIRRRLADCYYNHAGRIEEALAIEEEALATLERRLGPDDRAVLVGRASLGTAHWQAGRVDRAITILDRALDVSERVCPDHPDTLAIRGNLATAHWQAGHINQVITHLERLLADSRRIHGADHTTTILALAGLAAAYVQVGRADELSTLLE
ncbi:tetratricopeptide repeat protein [Streptomyces sp. NPDC059396]|uniref:tetratricopeptide repeat protein n=1 Tax=Streptomyces sp. NPDC059396 TaxID=3346819 RepID=UPI0036940D9E